jgi:hypothetical protein
MYGPTNERTCWRYGKIEIDEIDPNYIGRFGEQAAQEELKRLGFDIKPFCDWQEIEKCEHVDERKEICRKRGCPFRHPTDQGELVTRADEGGCEYCFDESLKYCLEVCEPMCRPRKVWEIVESVRKKYGVSNLDFFITKDGKEWCVEVKARESRVEPGQKEVMRRLKEELGIDSVVLRVEIKRAIDYSIEIEKGPDEFLKQSHSR